MGLLVEMGACLLLVKPNSEYRMTVPTLLRAEQFYLVAPAGVQGALGLSCDGSRYPRYTICGDDGLSWNTGP